MPERVSINLASEPFRKERALYVASAFVAVLLAVVLAMLISLAVTERDSLKDARDTVAKLELQLRKLGQEETRLQAAMRKPENGEVLERSVFLNVLLLRKGISWTRMFADLEKVLPHNVRLISIRPQVVAGEGGRNELLLDMVVGAQSTEPVIDMLMRLEASPLFGATSVSSFLPPTQTDPLFRYRVSVNYAQKL